MLIWNLIKPIKSLVNQTFTMINQWKHSKNGGLEMYKQYMLVLITIFIYQKSESVKRASLKRDVLAGMSLLSYWDAICCYNAWRVKPPLALLLVAELECFRLCCFTPISLSYKGYLVLSLLLEWFSP